MSCTSNANIWVRATAAASAITGGVLLGFSTLVMPALIGVTMGRNPSGAISDVVQRFKGLRAARPVLAIGLGLEGVIYLLALNDTISTWWFAALTAALAVLLPVAGQAGTAVARRREPLGDAVPLDLVGVDRPFSERDRVQFDEALAIADQPVPPARKVARARA